MDFFIHSRSIKVFFIKFLSYGLGNTNPDDSPSIPITVTRAALIGNKIREKLTRDMLNVNH